MISKAVLTKLYTREENSISEVATILNCSDNKVVYWLKKHDICRRTRSDAAYIKHNPDGDPFKIRNPCSMYESELLGLGIGLYWGEGTKANDTSVRLGNSDPELLIKFIEFLEVLCGVKNEDLKFGLQLFSDVDTNQALQFWIDSLGVKSSQMYKPYVSISGSVGSYRKKSKYGVLTLYYNNKKLRDYLVGLLPESTSKNY